MFFIKYQQQTNQSDADSVADEFEKICMAAASFFIIWRVTFNSYPDAAYKQMFAEHFSVSKLAGNEICFQDVARVMRQKLYSELKEVRKKRKISSIKLWEANLQYNKQGYGPLIRFILMIAAHRKVRDVRFDNTKLCGLVTNDTTGPNYLLPNVWVDSDYASLEHVVPQKMYGYSGSPIKYWNADFLSGNELQSIGNLSLLSSALNSSVPEETEEKAKYYFGLINPGAPAVSPTASSLIASSPYLGHLSPVVFRLIKWIDDIKNNSVSPEASVFAWDPEFIRARRKNIIRLVTRELFNWLV